MIGRRALLAGGAAIVLGGCGVPRLPGLPGSKGTEPKPTSPPATVTLDKLWDTSELGHINSADLAGDVVILAGGLKGGRNIPFLADIGGFAVVDGKQRWSSTAVDQQLAKINPSLSLSDGQVVCGPDADPVVVAPTYQNPCPDGKEACSTAETTQTDGKGIVAVRAADGRLLWHNLLLPAVSRHDPTAAQRDDEYLKVIAGDGTRVLYIAGANDVVNGGSAPTSGQRIWTGLLDLAAGKELWRADDTVGKYLAGDVVLVDLVGPGDGAGTDSENGPVAALDAASGRRLWSTVGTSAALGRWLFGAAGLAGLQTSKSGGAYRSDLLLDARTGKTLYTEKRVMLAASAGIGPDGVGMAVWVSTDSGLFAGPDERLRSWSGSGPLRTGSQKLPEHQTPSSTTIINGTVWYSYDGSDDKEQTAAIDLWGRQLCTPVIGQLEAADGAHAILLHNDTATIYRVS